MIQRHLYILAFRFRTYLKNCDNNKNVKCFGLICMLEGMCWRVDGFSMIQFEHLSLHKEGGQRNLGLLNKIIINTIYFDKYIFQFNITNIIRLNISHMSICLFPRTRRKCGSKMIIIHAIWTNFF